jgi:hypothetical protein
MLPTMACAALGAHLAAAIRRRWVRALLVPCLAATLWLVSADYLALARDRPRNASVIDAADWGRTEEARATAFIDRGFDPARALYPPNAQSGRWSIMKGKGVVDAESVRDHELLLHAMTDAGMEISIKEPGAHHIRVAFTNTALRMVANSVSGGSFLVGIAWLARLVVSRDR